MLPIKRAPIVTRFINTNQATIFKYVRKTFNVSLDKLIRFCNHFNPFKKNKFF